MKTAYSVFLETCDLNQLVGLCVRTNDGNYGTIDKVLEMPSGIFCVVDGDGYYNSWPDLGDRKGVFPAWRLKVVPIKGEIKFIIPDNFGTHSKRNFCGEWDQEFSLFKGFITGIGNVVLETSKYGYEASLEGCVLDSLKSKLC